MKSARNYAARWQENKYAQQLQQQACDRYGVSDRTAAAIATAASSDVGVITATDYSNVINRSKVKGARFEMRESSQSNPLHSDVRSLYFDGRKTRPWKTFWKRTASIIAGF